MSENYTPPARNAHGATYWLLVGWWWAPLKLTGRMLLWLFMWPLGLWRSIANSRSKREARERRGYQKAQKQN